MKRLLLSLFATAALLFAGLVPAQVSVDAGKTGISRGMHLLCSSAVAASVTGTTNETALATCTIPAGAMGSSGAIEIRATWSTTNNANAKWLRFRFGGASGTLFAQVTSQSSLSSEMSRRIRNRGSASSQVGSMSSTGLPFGSTSTSAVATSNTDTGVNVDVAITGQLEVGTDTATLQMYEVWLLP